MNYKKWEAGKKAGINFSNCYHFDESTNGNICGAMATWAMPMPGDIPDMPVCRKHKPMYEKMDADSILKAMFDQYTEYLNEEDDDDT
jgi:hypothetical protein